MILFVTFDAAEAAQLSGFAVALGDTFEVAAVPADAPPADALAKAIADQAAGFSHVVAVSSMAAKDVLARVAGLLDATMVSDVTAVDGPNRYVRPIFAGAVLQTVEAQGSPVVLTFRPSGFEATGATPAATHELSAAPGRTERLAASQKKGGRPDLAQAKRVVSGGKPLKDAATFESVIGGLADALGAAVGATRAAVDTGIAPNDIQVGQTGKVVAPGLYIAAGISGSTQHVAGIKDSKVIVAINKDPDAPIFEVADLGLVADLFDAVPELTAKLKS